MTAEEIRKSAEQALFVDKIKKGKKLMRQAADGGDRIACGKTACFLVEEKKWLEAKQYFEKENSFEDNPNEYVHCLAVCASKTKKRETKERAQMLSDADRVQNKLKGNGRYWYATLLHSAEPDNVDAYRLHLILAAIDESSDMPDELYEFVNRERGVFGTKAEISSWLKKDHGAFSVGFLPCNLTKDDAVRAAGGELGMKEARKAMPMRAKSAFKKGLYKATLEYQKVIRYQISAKTVSLHYEYSHPNSSYIEKGSGTVDVNSYWTDCYATFLTKQDQKDLYKIYKDVKPEQTFVDARMRVNPAYEKVVTEECRKKAIADAANGSKSTIKQTIAQQYRWDKRYIKLTIDDNAMSVRSQSEIYVPFYFFTVKLSPKKSSTIRVNAYTGETDLLINNPFGQFTGSYYAEKGGGARIELQKK